MSTSVQSDQTRQWLQKVHQVQFSRMTPERREELKKRAEQARHVQEVQSRTRNLRKKCMRSQAPMKCALRDMSAAASAPSAPAQQKQAYDDIMEHVEMAYENMDEDDDGTGMGMYGLLNLHQADTQRRITEDEALEAEEGLDGQAEFEQLLSELKREPTDESEVAAKFKLFERYLGTVETVRKEVFAFWDEVRPVLPEGSVKREVGKQMQDIDSEQNTGVADFVPGRWFVYDITKKAAENNTMMSRILKGLESKLKLLNEADVECPFCLEPLGDSHPAKSLGCCHRVGADCWEQWVDFQGPGAACPLCRNTDFLDLLQQAA